MTQNPDGLVEIVRGKESWHRIVRLLSKGLCSKAVIRLAALGTFVFFLVEAFRPGWIQPETDFPNYYTAAVLVRQHQHLHNYYDWSWFARQMNYAGNGMQIGAYLPQTPLAMLPMVGIAGFPPQEAKQIWLLCNLLFLGVTIWLLSRVTGFRFEVIWLLAFCGYFSLRTNFLDGQYYVFLLFMLTLAFYLLDRQRNWLGGVATGFAFVLKLYGGPFLLYFVIKRQWKALFGMMAVVLVLGGVALVLFGPADLRYYATQILPRSLETGQVDPYNPGAPSISSLLMRTFVAEPELNPHPLWQAPWLCFFLRSFISLATVTFLLLGVGMKRTTDRHNFAWFVVATFLLSTSTSSYSYIVLLLPLVLAAARVWTAAPLHSGSYLCALDIALAARRSVPQGRSSRRTFYLDWLALLAGNARANVSARDDCCGADRFLQRRTAHEELSKRARTTLRTSRRTERCAVLLLSRRFKGRSFLPIDG